MRCRGCHRPFFENDRARVIRNHVYHEGCVIAGVPLHIDETVPDGNILFIHPKTGETMALIVNVGRSDE